MPATVRVVLLATALAGGLFPLRATAQGSPYITLDDPRLPLLEHLIARGDIEDPSPMVRPFRRADAERILAAADTSADSRAGRIIGQLRSEFKDPSGNPWRLSGRVGAQAYTHARRELLHPVGPDGVNPYAEVGGSATFGNLVLVTRPTVEPRLVDDPDWPGRKDVGLAGAAPPGGPGRRVGGGGGEGGDGYTPAHLRAAPFFFGHLDQIGARGGWPGFPPSNWGYGGGAPWKGAGGGQICLPARPPVL